MLAQASDFDSVAMDAKIKRFCWNQKSARSGDRKFKVSFLVAGCLLIHLDSAISLAL